MTSQIQIDYNKRKKNQNEKNDKTAKRWNKRPKISTIDKEDSKSIKHGLNSITSCICLQDVEKKMSWYYNSTSNQSKQKKKRNIWINKGLFKCPKKKWIQEKAKRHTKQ